MLTDRQAAYCSARAAGHAQKQAAVLAGYSESSAAQQASRLERNPSIAAQIEALRGQARQPAAADGQTKYETAESFLQAVVAGTEAADPVRVSAARALIQYQTAKKRAPVASPPPAQLAQREALSTETAAREAWLKKSAEVRARHAKKESTK